ncbi:hypothetical protein TSUD_250580 [Trifolium subterraneum]|nr:hypothetical protein TSUD_250580 [Trifolium subterraneum]
MTKTSCSSRTAKLLLLIISFLHVSFALTSDGLNLLSLLTHWTFVPTLISSSWKASDSSPCSWVGVQCDHTNDLISLNLTSYGLFGQLGPEIGNLYHLQTLVLLGNGFSGKVPLELSNCSFLENLDLSGNKFSGNIPYGFKNLQNLQFMRLSSNMLTEFSNLRELQLGGNLFGGKIPLSMGSFQNLFYGLNLSANGLTGGIPSEIGKLKMLQSLDISLNNLSGSIHALEDLGSLIEVNISYNLFNGSVPIGLVKLLNSSPSSFTGNVQIVMIELGSSILISAILSNVTSLVSWARSVWLETGKIEYIADSYLAEAFPNSAALSKQVTTMFLLALQCTEKDPRKRPTMKDVIGLYKRDMFKWCDEEEYSDTVAADTSLQPYSPNIFPIIPVVSIDHHIQGESSRAAAQRQRDVTFTVEAESMDYSDFRLWQVIDQFQFGFCVEDDWSRIPTIYIDGLLVQLMGNGKVENIVDPYLASSFPNSPALAKQVTKAFILALQCTDRDLQNRPTMKDVIDMYNSDLFKWSRGEVEHRDAVAANHNASGQLS